MSIGEKKWSGEVVLLGLVFLLAGCASTGKRYEKAAELEAAGRYSDASEYYIKVLKKEPSWQEARTRLMSSGGRAVDLYLQEARSAEQAQNYEQALRMLGKLDDLRDRAREVSVTFPVPEDYAGFRERLVGNARTALLDEGARAEAAGRWPEALNAFERVRARYAETPDLRRELDQARVRVYGKWSEQEMASGHFRAAYERAGQALALAGHDAPETQRLQELQTETLENGTRRLTLLPVWATERISRQTPSGFLEDLNDALVYRQGSEPPLFIEMTSPLELRRELRRLRYDRRGITRSEAAEVGKVLDTDYVVLLEAKSYKEEERNVREEARKAPLRGRTGGDTTYVMRRVTLALDASAQYQILDPYTRGVVDIGVVKADVAGEVRHGFYGGQYRDLVLSDDEQRLFDEAAQRAKRQELEDRLVEKLAERLSDRLFDVILSRIR